MNVHDYRRTSNSARDAFHAWKKECPFERHHVVSFNAGYNAALAAVKQAAQKQAAAEITNDLVDDIANNIREGGE